MDNNKNEYNFWTDQAGTTKDPEEVQKKEESTDYNEYNSSEQAYEPQSGVYRMTASQLYHEKQEDDTQSQTESVNDNNQNPPVMDGKDQKEPKKKNPNVKKFIHFVSAAAVFGLVAGCSFWGINQAIEYLDRSRSTQVQQQLDSLEDQPTLAGGKIEDQENNRYSQINIPSTTVIQDASVRESDVTTVVKNTMPSIVSILGTFKQSGITYFGQYVEEELPGSGSGIIVGKNDTELLIVTNNHVVDGAVNIMVTFIDEESVEAEVRGKDSTEDLAVLAIKLSDINKDTLSQIKVATLGDSDVTEVGEKVVAIGNALGYGQSTTVGYVSAKNRTIYVDNREMQLLQTDAAINPGNSGGALLNVNGEVIGINSVKYTNTAVEGIGYAIPISKAIPIINELMNLEKLEENEKGYLGVEIEDIAKENELDMPVGIFIRKVTKGSAAEKAGIVQGDIVTKVNNITVTTREALKEKVSSYRAGKTITLTVMRYQNGDYIEKNIDVTLQAMEVEETAVPEEETRNNKSKQKDNSNEDGSSDEDLYEEFFNRFFQF